MLIDAKTVPDATVVETDLCIIGAGAAGITLALALADAPFDTIILESGAMSVSGDAQRLNAGEIVGLPYFPLIGSRLRGFGGTTNHWGGTCRPFDEQDFIGVAGQRDSTWPIRLSDVAPYYPRATQIVGLTSDVWGAEVWSGRSPFDPLPLDPTVFETRVAQVVDSTRRSFDDLHRATVEASAVRVYLNATVLGLHLRDDHAAVRTATVGVEGARRFTVTARTFVLAAGGIENPRLLLASNDAQPAGIGNGDGVVGRYFLEHPRFVGGVIEALSDEAGSGFYTPHRVDDTRILGYLSTSRASQAAAGRVDVQIRLYNVLKPAYERARQSAEVAALRRFADRLGGRDRGAFIEDALVAADDLTSWRRLLVPGAPLPLPPPELVQLVSALTPEQFDAIIPEFFGDIALFAYDRVTNAAPLDRIELSTRIAPVPNPDSRVTLGGERDAFGMPVARLDWQLSRVDHESVRSTLELLGREIGRIGLGRVQVRLPENDQWPDDLAGGYHHMGTTRMGLDPRHSVVDADCRVHAVSNLFVAGSSVFTTGGSATPTLTLVALSLRLADHLRAELR